MTRLRPFIFLTLVFGVFLWVLYGSSVSLWMDQLPGSGEDGAKNFYTLAYHVEHDSNSLWFEGMNYPFGEHVSFTDNQPLIANSLRLVNRLLPIENNLLSILPWLLILSALIGSFFVFDILKTLGLSQWLAIVGATLIIFMNPQWLRFSGHYSLAYAFIIPWYIWLLLNYTLKDGKTILYLILVPFVSALIHPYFLAMLALFGGSVLLIHYWKSSSLNNWQNLGKIVLTVIGPILLFQLFLSLTDPVVDRSSSPFGFLVYRATLSSVFLPVSLPHGALFESLVPGWFRQSEEGGFYIGILALIALLVGIIAFSKDILKNRFRPRPISPHALLLLGSIPVLLLALGFPFIIKGQSYLLDFMGPLKQFRGIGRFSFVFFFAINLFGLKLISDWLNEHGLKRIVSLAMLCVMIGEVVLYSNYIQEHTSSGSSTFHDRQYPDFIEPDEYQAILPLPFYHIGSENFRTSHDPGIVIPSMNASLKLGLPLMSVQMSRTSYRQTKSSLQLANHHLSNIELISDLNEKPLLLIVDPNKAVKKSEVDLIGAASWLGQHDALEFYTLSIKELLKIGPANQQSLLPDSLLTTIDDFSMIKERWGFHFNGFDDIQSESSFKGTGAFQFERRDWTSLIPEGYLWPKSEEVIVSFWINAADQNIVNTQVWLETNAEGESVLELSEICDHLQAISGDWALIEFQIPERLQNESTQIKLHRDGPKVNVLIDELIIRPKSLNVKRSGAFNMNNYYYSQEVL